MRADSCWSFSCGSRAVKVWVSSSMTRNTKHVWEPSTFSGAKGTPRSLRVAEARRRACAVEKVIIQRVDAAFSASFLDEPLDGICQCCK